LNSKILHLQQFLSEFIDLLEILLKNADKNENIKKSAVEALICAISNRNIEGVKHLIDFGVDINQNTSFGRSALHEATDTGNSGTSPTSPNLNKKKLTKFLF
jgi:hypothetical protein